MNEIKKTETEATQQEQNQGFALGKMNYLFILIGFVLIIIGFALMSGGKSTDPNVFNKEIFNFRRITLAPIIILLGFVLEIFAILWRPKK